MDMTEIFELLDRKTITLKQVDSLSRKKTQALFKELQEEREIILGKYLDELMAKDKLAFELSELQNKYPK